MGDARKLWVSLDRGARRRLYRSRCVLRSIFKRLPVILGGDTPLGEQLATSLSGQGFIVLPTFNSTASQQAFMRQVRPSSQGYVKPLLLNDSVKPARGGSIESFTAALSSALELKWPLTGAGDPFARSGERIRVAGVINALSWDERASFDENAHDVASLVEQRLSTPFAALHALLPILRSLADDRCTEQPAVVLTLVAPKSSTPGPASITRAAALESMRSLAHDCSKSRTPLTRVVRCATLQVRAPHTTSNAASAPHAPRRTTINPRGETIPSTKSSQVLGSPNDDMSVLSRTTARLLLLPSSTPLRAFYVVGPPLRVNLAAFLKSRVPEHASLSLAQVFVAAPSLVWTHATAVSVRLISMLRRAGPRLGFGGAAPRRQPAFGPGPGPVSNSHSRTAIGRGATAAGSTNASAASTRGRTRSSSSTRKSTRPLSTHSANASSEEESNGPSSSNGGACMESSGLLSSVPSSAFGDGDQLSTHGVESPTFSSRGPNSPHWGPSSTENATASGSSVFEDYAGTTPSASRVASSAGFQLPSEASSRHAASHAEDGPWMGPPSREAPSPHLAPHSETRSGVDSPLGQSWVALGQSQTENAPS